MQHSLHAASNGNAVCVLSGPGPRPSLAVPHGRQNCAASVFTYYYCCCVLSPMFCGVSFCLTVGRENSPKTMKMTWACHMMSWGCMDACARWCAVALWLCSGTAPSCGGTSMTLRQWHTRWAQCGHTFKTRTLASVTAHFTDTSCCCPGSGSSRHKGANSTESPTGPGGTNKLNMLLHQSSWCHH
jgi:hypothetical protein